MNLAGWVALIVSWAMGVFLIGLICRWWRLSWYRFGLAYTAACCLIAVWLR